MAKSRRKKGDAKLRVIAGGATPKAVVTGVRAPRAASVSAVAAAQPKAGPANVRRDASAASEATPPVADELRVSTVAKTSPVSRNALARVAIFAVLVVAIGFAAWALTRGAFDKPPAAPAPALSAIPPTGWAATSVVPIAAESAPPPATSAPPSATAAPATPSIVAAPSNAATAAAPPATTAPTPAAPPATTAPTPTATPPVATATPTPSAVTPPAAPKPAAPKPAPKAPADDDPYQ